MPRVLLIGPNDSSVAFLDDREIAVDLLQSPDRVTGLQRARGDRVALVDLGDTRAAHLAAAELHREARFDGVMAFHEVHLELASQLSAQLGVDGNPLTAVRTTRDKAATRAVVNGCGLHNPKYAIARHPSELARAIGWIGYPSVAKPLDAGGSVGVRVLAGPVDVAALTPPTPNAQLIIESYINGRELSVETVSSNGQHEVAMVTEKLVTGGRYRVELGHQMPARLSPDEYGRLARSVCGLLDRVGHVVGPAHTEVRLSADGIYLVETHVRHGGDRIWEMTGLVTGCYPQAFTVAALSRRPRPRRAPVARAAAIRFVTARAGVLADIRGAAEARAVPGVLRVAIDAAPGQTVGELTDSDQRLGYALAVGDTVSSAASAATRALRCIQVQVE